MTPESPLNDLLDQLAARQGWKDGGRFIRLHPVLVGGEAEALAARRSADARAAGDERGATAFAAMERVLRLCRQHGIDLGLIRAATAEAEERLEATPPGDDARVDNLYFLGIVLEDDFNSTRDADRLRRAIEVMEEGIEAGPVHERRPLLLISLGRLLQQRFLLRHEMYDLMHAVDLADEAVAVCPTDSLARAGVLSDAAVCRRRMIEVLRGTFDTDSTREVLDRALAELEEALSRTERSAKERPARLAQYGTTLKLHYAVSGDVADLDRAIETWREAGELVPPGSGARSHAWENVGSALYERYRRRGDRNDLQRGVRALESALDLMPVDARERAAVAARAEEAIAELQRSSAP